MKKTSKLTIRERIEKTYEDLLLKYDSHPLIRMGLKLLPVTGGMVDHGLMALIDDIRLKRRIEYYDELATGTKELTDEEIRNDEFLHCYFSTEKYALNTHRKEKIRLFAKLLKNGIIQKKINIQIYEGYLELLDSLSFFDIQILEELYKYERNNATLNSLPTQRVILKDSQKFKDNWSIFEQNIIDKLHVDKTEIHRILYKLHSMGLIDQQFPTRPDGKGSLTMGTFFGFFRGTLTPLYHRLREYITDNY